MIGESASVTAVMMALIGGYLAGSIPFGLLLTRMAGLGDIRSIGSGNIGATNVLRTGNKWLAAATLLLDALKGLIPVLIAKQFGDGAALAAGFGAFAGHLYPIWLRFVGGKGVATFVGVSLGYSWMVLAIVAITWLLTAWLTRYSSLAALVATSVTTLTIALVGPLPLAGLYAVLTAMVFIKHRANIARLQAGTEPRIGGKS